MDIQTVKKYICLGLFLGFPLGGRALDMTPEFFQFKGVPHARLKASVTLVNDSSVPAEVLLDLRGPAVKGDTSWIAVSPRKLKIPAGKSQVARLTVRVPRGSGERWAQVWARAAGPISSTEIRVVRKVNLIIEGTENYALSFDRINAVDRGDRVEVEVGFRNDGNVTVRPKLGAQLLLSDGARASAYQEENASPVAPGKLGSARVAVPLSGSRWEGQGTMTLYCLDSAGQTRRVEKSIGGKNE